MITQSDDVINDQEPPETEGISIQKQRIYEELQQNDNLNVYVIMIL